MMSLVGCVIIVEDLENFDNCFLENNFPSRQQLCEAGNSAHLFQLRNCLGFSDVWRTPNTDCRTTSEWCSQLVLCRLLIIG